MEVVAATPAGSGGVPPFHDHDVREWSRIDSLTGALERARLETDHWTTNTNNSCHKYNKVVDSRARSDADGAVQQQARRQLEVFQSQIPGGQLQVIKTHTVSSSRWTNKGEVSSGITGNPLVKDFENLQLSLNPLDLTSQKSKASVGRSVSRRPPSRQRARIEPSLSTNNVNNPLHLTAATNLHRVSRLCHQIHDNAVKQAFGKRSSPPRLAIQDRQNGDGRSSVENYENETNLHHPLTRTKSTSSEDIHKDPTTKSIEDLEDLEQLQNWRRTSKIRRSLQFPKQTKPKILDLPEPTVSVRKIREDLEKGRRLNTALRGNTVDLEALDQILQSISSSSSIHSDKTIEDLPDDSSENDQEITVKKQKRNSFVTVESLQEVRGRLRRTSSPSVDIQNSSKDEEETDDGIVTEEHRTEKTNRVRSYVFGMEAMLKKPTLGTNSLESRTKLTNGTSGNRNEDWYNRRKSYGFEQVHAHQEPTSIALKDKNFVESSTDSGICRSTEIVVVPTATRTSNLYEYSSDESQGDSKKFNGGNVRKMANIFKESSDDSTYKSSGFKSTTITIPIAKTNNNIVDLPWMEDKDSKRHSIAVDESKYVTKPLEEPKYRRTSLAFNQQDLDDDSSANGRKKKVEFCKTEVHFAADSGKVNIVETDEKPPPTNNFRRRRRNSGPINTNGLPMLHFGDTSYEKTMFGLVNDDEETGETIYENLQPKTQTNFGLVTVNTIRNPITSYHNSEMAEQDLEAKKELLEMETIKGILKNKPVKPKPYHLGQPVDDDGNKWGVRLRHVTKDEVPMWKSTVTVHSYDTSSNDEEQPEFQRLLRNLRPTKKPDFFSDSEQRYSDSFSGIRVVPPKDNRRSSWSVADKPGETTRGYSTKVNFGEGEAIVVESDSYRQKTWPRTSEDLSKDEEIPVAKPKYSPLVPRKPLGPRNEFRVPDKLSSPFLVGKNSSDLSEKLNGRESPPKSFSHVPDNKLQNKSANDMVLRQPKKSEMTYFGVKVSPRPVKKPSETSKLSDKPDLLQHYTPNLVKARRSSPDPKPEPSAPIYENIRGRSETKKGKYSSTREFDSGILDELTKAADQILQAVNGYTDEDSSHQRLSNTDEDDLKKKNSNQLDTISETKSWTRGKPQAKPSRPLVNSKVKLKHTSSTSSVESCSRQRKNLVKAPVEKQEKKKVDPKANTKARRLQRASSREALLQSHGSSSEDITGAVVEAPVRKPRLVKKTKAAQLTISNGLELKKPAVVRKKEEVKAEERILGSLPEIRHKTAVSTIRSTAEKNRARHKIDEDQQRKKPIQKRVVNSSRMDKTRSGTTSMKETVTHRVSTANIKKCHRAEAAGKH